MTSQAGRPGDGPARPDGRPAASGPAKTAQPAGAREQRRRYRFWAWAFIGAGTILLAHNLRLLPPGLLTRAVAVWPVLMILAGAFILYTGRVSAGFGPLPFAIERGSFQEAHLHVRTTWADVRVTAFAGASQLAVGQFPAPAGPSLLVEGQRAGLILDRRAVAPLMAGDWSVSLVKGLPWWLALQNGFGRFELNLRDLTVPSVCLRSLFGDVDLTLPASGQGEMDVRLTLGDLILRVPEGVALRIRLTASPLTGVRLDEQRFLKIAAGEWVTPNFSLAPHRFSLTIALGTGDLLLVV